MVGIARSQFINVFGSKDFFLYIQMSSKVTSLRHVLGLKKIVSQKYNDVFDPKNCDLSCAECHAFDLYLHRKCLSYADFNNICCLIATLSSTVFSLFAPWYLQNGIPAPKVFKKNHPFCYTRISWSPICSWGRSSCWENYVDCFIDSWEGVGIWGSTSQRGLGWNDGSGGRPFVFGWNLQPTWKLHGVAI